MLDISFIRLNSSLLKEVARKKKIPDVVDEFLHVDSKRRELKQRIDDLRHQKNNLSSIIKDAFQYGKLNNLSILKNIIEEIIALILKHPGLNVLGINKLNELQYLEKNLSENISRNDSNNVLISHESHINLIKEELDRLASNINKSTPKAVSNRYFELRRIFNYMMEDFKDSDNYIKTKDILTPLQNIQKMIKDELESCESSIIEIEKKYHELILWIPNVPLDSVPEGLSEDDNITIRKWEQIREFDFDLKDHVELGELLDIIDIPGGVKISGSRNYILKNECALLEMAVCNYAIKLAMDKGFCPFIVPHLVKNQAMYGTGYFPIGIEQAYTIEKDDLHLIGTSEVPLVSYLEDTILRESDLPIYYAGYSTCFRREAGTYGKDTKGIFRVHQFQKVEQVVFIKDDPDLSLKTHEFLLNNAEELVQALRLPYRVVTCCTAELGIGQVLKHDIEVWMPSRKTYSETHSCSSLYDFQSRRLNIRYKPEDGGKNRFPYTLNCTLVASPRILIPIIEHYQNADGSVSIPDVLKPYMHGIEKILPRKIS
jgi:seryl-tRNA synthetase